MATIYTTLAVAEILKEIKDGSGTFPSTWDAACFTTTPAIDGTGGVEINSGTHTWYSRKSIAFASPSGRTMANSGAVSFTTSATSSLGASPIVSLGIFAGGTNNLWIILPLTSPLSVGINSVVNFPVGQITQEFAAS